MWFYPLLALLVLLGLAGVIFLGGVYTLILVPLAVIGIVSVVVYSMWSRSLAANAEAETDASHTAERPLPASRRRTRAREPTRPEALVDARRQGARTPEQ
jgi:hypothetical protein